MSFANISKTFNGIILSALMLTIWNIISYIFEYRLLSSIYYSIPRLKKEINSDKQNKKSLLEAFKKTSIIYKGWLIYFKQGVLCLPGLSLAALFMTVLSFDSITIGFSKSQHLSESAISIIQAIGSVTGILGTIAFRIFHNKCKLNLKIIGIIGSLSQLSCLLICLLSIWMPGSSFELYTKTNVTSNFKNNGSMNETVDVFNNITLNSTIRTNQTSTFENIYSKFFLSPNHSYISIIMLLGGTALSRFG